MTGLDAQLATFHETGLVRLSGVFSEDAAARMRDAVWRDLRHTDGVIPDDPSTWNRPRPLKKLARAKRDPAFQALYGEQLASLADALLGPGWTSDAAFGNLLVDFPDADAWHLPGRDGFWHCDVGSYGSMDPLPALRVFAVFGEVPPGGGATLLVTGSGPMLVDYLRRHPDVEMSLKADVAWQRDIPWLRELTLSEVPADPEAREQRRRRFMDQVTDVEGFPLRVVEACGSPGDVYVCHPWTIHCKAPNASSVPRFLRAPTLFRQAATG